MAFLTKMMRQNKDKTNPSVYNSVRGKNEKSFLRQNKTLHQIRYLDDSNNNNKGLAL